MPTCIEAFTAVLGDRPNQLDEAATGRAVTAGDLLDARRHAGTVTLAGLRTNISVALQYLTAWVSGRGAVTIDNLMEDAATVEISRTQIWQWIRHAARMTGGIPITRDLVAAMLAEEVEQTLEDTDPDQRWQVTAARDILEHGCLSEGYPNFVTSYGYSHYLAGRSCRLPTASETMSCAPLLMIANS